MTRGPLRSTWVRFTVVSTLVLGVVLAATVALAWQLARVQGRAAVDDRLVRERDVFAARAPGLLRGASNADTPAATADLERRFRAYLATQPGSTLHLTALRVTGRPPQLTSSGPAPVLRLLASGGELPVGVRDLVVTRGTRTGPVRVLSAPVVLDGRAVGTLQVYGSFAAPDAQAAALAGRVALAALLAGLVGVVVLAVALRTATRPLRDLHDAADASRLGDLGRRVPDPDGRTDEVADLARAFNTMLDRLEAEVAARTALFASVSHELRTPVAVARGHLELLESGAAQDPAVSLRLVGTELGRLSRLLDDLLLLAAADADTFLVTSPVRVGRVVEELRFRIRGLDVDGVTVEGDDQDATTVLVDLDRVLQAVTNLVVNARRHTPPGTLVQVAVGAEAGVLGVTVEDDGPGIPAGLRARVFEPFARGGRGSTGLGLAVVRAVAEAHGGRARLDADGPGTVVRLSFGA